MGDLGSSPGLEKSPGERNGYPLQCSCLENLTDRGAWWATVHGVPKIWTHKRLTLILWLSQTSLPVCLPSSGWGNLWKSGLPLVSDRTFPSPAHVLQPACWDPTSFLLSILLPSFTLITFHLYWEWISPLLQPLCMTSSFPHQNKCSWRQLIEHTLSCIFAEDLKTLRISWRCSLASAVHLFC